MKEFKKMTEPMTTPGEEEIDASVFKEDLECLSELHWIVAYCQEILQDNPEWFVDDEGNQGGVPLTIGVSADGESCGWQTGDNSYTGGAYSYPHWAVTEVYADTTWEELLEELKQQILELAVW